MKNRKIKMTFAFGVPVFASIWVAMFLHQSDSVITALITLLGAIFASFVAGNGAEHVADAMKSKDAK